MVGGFGFGAVPSPPYAVRSLSLLFSLRTDADDVEQVLDRQSGSITRTFEATLDGGLPKSRMT